MPDQVHHLEQVTGKWGSIIAPTCFLGLLGKLNEIMHTGQVLVAHFYNPSYSRGRAQEVAVQSQPRQIVHKTLSRKNSMQKRAGGVTQGVGLTPQ
jgi:hypothetical protein